MWFNVYCKKKLYINYVKMDFVYWWKWCCVDYIVVEFFVFEWDVLNDDVLIFVYVFVCVDFGVVCYFKVFMG